MAVGAGSMTTRMPMWHIALLKNHAHVAQPPPAVQSIFIGSQDNKAYTYSSGRQLKIIERHSRGVA